MQRDLTDALVRKGIDPARCSLVAEFALLSPRAFWCAAYLLCTQSMFRGFISAEDARELEELERIAEGFVEATKMQFHSGSDPT